MIAAHEVIGSPFFIRRNRNVAPRLRVFCNDDIADFEVKTLNLLRRGGRCHQVHVRRDAVVLVDIGVVAQSNRKLVVERMFVYVAVCEIAYSLQRDTPPHMGERGQLIGAALSVTSRSNSSIRCSTPANSASISCNGRGSWYWKNTRLKLIS